MKLLLAAAVGIAVGYLFRRHKDAPTYSYPSVWYDTGGASNVYSWTTPDTPAT